MKLALLATLALAMASASSGAKPLTGVDMQLLSKVSSVAPDQPFTVGLHIRHHDGFHTYWKNPGIVGVPTSIKWSLPPGFSAGPIQWPYPEMVDMAGHPAHGFHREVLLMVEITPPAKLPSKTITLHAEIAWMACAKTCHPGNTTLSLTLPVSVEKPATASTLALFERADQELPKLLKPSFATVTVLSPPNSPVITFAISTRNQQPLPAKGLRFFSSDGQVSSNTPQGITQPTPGTVQLSLERSEYGPDQAPTLPGILAIPDPGSKSPTFLSINPRFPEKSKFKP